MTELYLAELVAWNRVHGAEPLRQLLAKELRTVNDYSTYEATDGNRGPADVGKVVGITSRAVLYKWASWRALGLIFDPPGEDHPRHLVSAKSIGVRPPEK